MSDDKILATLKAKLIWVIQDWLGIEGEYNQITGKQITNSGLKCYLGDVALGCNEYSGQDLNAHIMLMSLNEYLDNSGGLIEPFDLALDYTDFMEKLIDGYKVSKVSFKHIENSVKDSARGRELPRMFDKVHAGLLEVIALLQDKETIKALTEKVEAEITKTGKGVAGYQILEDNFVEYAVKFMARVYQLLGAHTGQEYLPLSPTEITEIKENIAFQLNIKDELVKQANDRQPV